MRREINFVDDQQIGARDARPALARDLLALGDIDNIDGEIGEFRTEGRGKVVAAAFDQHQIEIGEALAE